MSTMPSPPPSRHARFYRSLQVCALAGITFRQLDYWCRNGSFRPSTGARGSGTQRRYTEADVAVLAVLGRLAALGCRAPALGAAARWLEMLAARGELRGWLIVHPDGAVTPLSSDGFECLPGPGWCVPLDPPWAEHVARAVSARRA